MTRYQDLSEAFYKTAPARHRLDQNIRKLPGWLLNAVVETLQAPEGEMDFLTEMHGQPIGYVFFARRTFSAQGFAKWEPVTDGIIYHRGETRFSSFGIGVALEEREGSFTPHFVHAGMHIEVQSETVVHLYIDGTDRMVPIEFGKPETLKRAAVEFVDWLHDFVKDPAGTYEPKLTIGFGRQEEE